MAAQATASNASSPAISRPRRVRRPSQRWKGLACRPGAPSAPRDGPRPGSLPASSPVLLANTSSAHGFEHVSNAADGVDQRLAVRVDLLAQVADVQLHDVSLAAEVVVPDPVEDLGL